MAKEGQPTAEDIEAQKKWREGTAAAEVFDMVEHISNLRKEDSAPWRTRCHMMIFHHYSITGITGHGQLQSHQHQNHDPECIQRLIDRLRVIDQYDVLHITAEIRFVILRR